VSSAHSLLLCTRLVLPSFDGAHGEENTEAFEAGRTRRASALVFDIEEDNIEMQNDAGSKTVEVGQQVGAAVTARDSGVDRIAALVRASPIGSGRQGRQHRSGRR
jgi:hypothetical protein